MTTQQAAYQLLVVDPSQETQARIGQQLQGRGYSVVAASDPDSAMTLIDSVAPDIVITDLFLREGTGMAFVKDLYARRELCPVIVMALEAPEQTILEAFRAGAVDYLHKPIAEAELAHVLQRAKDVIPDDLTDLPGIRSADYRLSVDSDPAHIPGIVSWLIKTTASTVSPIRQLQLRGALQELLFNAVEHGNLEISSQDKQKALLDGQYEKLVATRRSQAQLRDRSVTIHIVHDRAADRLVYRIIDEGKGFQWRTLLDHAHEARESEAENGRGIFLTRAFFPTMIYNERGNEVALTMPLS